MRSTSGAGVAAMSSGVAILICDDRQLGRQTELAVMPGKSQEAEANCSDRHQSGSQG